MYRLTTLGGIDLRGPSGPLSGRSTQPRPLALLVLLARHPGSPVTREKAVGLLWPEVPERRARRRLSDALYALRQDLGSEAVRSEGGRLRLEASLLEVDVAAFDEALREGRLREAVEGYEGPFLDGFHLGDAGDFDRWVEEERRGIARRYQDALEALAEAAQEAGEREEAVRWWQRRAEAQPTDSRVAVRLMAALAAAGNIPRALAAARSLERELREELDLPLPEEVREFATALAGDGGPQGARPRALGAEGRREARPTPGPAGGRGAPGPGPGPGTGTGSEGAAPEPTSSPQPTHPPRTPRRRRAGGLLGVGILAGGGVLLAALLLTPGPGGIPAPGVAVPAGEVAEPPSPMPPTALEHHLQGKAYLARQFSPEAVSAAIQQFERAVSLDPGFTEAWRRLIHARLWLAWVHDDREAGARARDDLDRLLALGGGDPEVRLGRGWHLYYGERRYEEALREFEAVRAVRPGDPELLRVIGFLRQRLGRWEEGLEAMEEAAELDPTDAEVVFAIGQTHRWMGRPGEALEAYARAFSLAPEEDVAFLHSNVEQAHLALGDSAGARRARERAWALGAGAWEGGRAELYHGSLAGALARIQAHAAPSPTAEMYRLDVLADIHRRLGDEEARRTHADSLLSLALSQAPEGARGAGGQAAALAWIFAGLAHLHLGNVEEGIGKVERGLALEAPFDDALVGPFLGATASRAFVRAGALDRALDLLARASRRPALYSAFDLAWDPEWDPLRDHPRWPEVVGDPPAASASSSNSLR
jgi:DNA-binding SARP family transcriptional activator